MLYNLEILLFKKNRDNINKKDREKLLCLFFGAGGVTRTRDLRITNALLYQLSYTSEVLNLIVKQFKKLCHNKLNA